MNKAFEDSSQGDLAYILHHLENYHEGPRPEFVAVVSWLSLHEMNHCGGETDADFVYTNDLVKDYFFRDDLRKAVGFHDNEFGREALALLEGWLGLDQLWKLNSSGEYEEIPVPQSCYSVDVNNPLEVKNVIHDFALRHGLKGLQPE